MNIYMSGTVVRTAAAFTDVNGNPADPDAVLLKYKTGASATTTVTFGGSGSPAITKDSIGNYHADFDTTGWTGPNNILYSAEWKGTGMVQAIGADYFEVEPPVL